MSKSTENTKPEPLPEPTQDLALITATSPESVKDTQIAQLEEELQKEKDDRKEERFLWICVGLILFNAMTFNKITTLAGVFGILFTEGFVLLLLAQCFGLEKISMVINHWLEKSWHAVWPKSKKT